MGKNAHLAPVTGNLVLSFSARIGYRPLVEVDFDIVVSAHTPA
jgi:hypothetical protein